MFHNFNKTSTHISINNKEQIGLFTLKKRIKWRKLIDLVRDKFETFPQKSNYNDLYFMDDSELKPYVALLVLAYNFENNDYISAHNQLFAMDEKGKEYRHFTETFSPSEKNLNLDTLKLFDLILSRTESVQNFHVKSLLKKEEKYGNPYVHNSNKSLGLI